MTMDNERGGVQYVRHEGERRRRAVERFLRVHSNLRGPATLMGGHVKMARAVIALLGGRTPMQVIVGGISKPGVEGADTQQSDLVGLGELSRPLSWRCDYSAGSSESKKESVSRSAESCERIQGRRRDECRKDGTKKEEEEERKKKTCVIPGAAHRREGADTQQSDLVGLGELSRPLSWRCDWGSTSSTGALVHRLDESGRVQQLSAHQILEFSGDGGECGRTSSVSMCGHWNHDEEEKKKKTCAETETQRAQEKGKSLSDLRVWNC
eukprot:CAMPEP_0174248166 /NCGR_PEP_ID=MMETSP0417-20130205/42940_1 /TAXON_ID=242541 /ORGANISM="Mayorella sp, Strain BSH-02190019" /LENGTH=266 /DNA_ID=CAMNT_0015328027 /DNA_START=938 /DNA_END=1739 /DNA_ORIENTATION=+